MKIINFFGGPSTGKSRTAARTFADLKDSDVNAELIHEFAKDKTWERHDKVLKCQPYVTGKQFWMQYRLMGEVQVAVTDSPLINGCIYCKDSEGNYSFGTSVAFYQSVIDMFNSFDNINIFLVRNDDIPFNQKGRRQNKEESKDIDAKTRKILDTEGIPYHVVHMDKDKDKQMQEIRKILWEEGAFE